MPSPNNTVPGLVDPQDSSVMGWIRYLASIPKQADDSAEAEFPGSARDSSVKNAYRHSLGSGMLAQELGANEGGARGIIAQALAKGAGYAWELLDTRKNIEDPKHWLDTKHDLNANAVGIDEAALAKSKEELAAILRQRALQSVPVQPPGPFEPSPGYLTRTVP